MNNRRLIAFALAILMAGAAVAQENEGFRVVETVTPPISDTSLQVQTETRRKRRPPSVRYVTELEGDLMSGRERAPPRETTQKQVKRDIGGAGLAILIILALLLIALKFGGGGTLLTRPPRDETAEDITPDAWRDTADETTAPSELLARLAAMEDRGAALVILLRHTLLSGARRTGTRLARADTERSAFARLPRDWAGLDPLGRLLRQTELAHYGGRAVDDVTFSEALNIGRELLADRGTHG